MAMALAELGHYRQQRGHRRRGAGREATVVGRLSTNLDWYRAGRPCHTPWRADEAIFSWRISVGRWWIGPV